MKDILLAITRISLAICGAVTVIYGGDWAAYGWFWLLLAFITWD